MRSSFVQTTLALLDRQRLDPRHDRVALGDDDGGDRARRTDRPRRRRRASPWTGAAAASAAPDEAPAPRGCAARTRPRTRRRRSARPPRAASRRGSTGTGCAAPWPSACSASSSGDLLRAVDDLVVAVDGEVGVVRRQAEGQAARLGEGLRDGRLDRRQLRRVVQLVAEDVEEDVVDPVLGLGVPGAPAGPRRHSAIGRDLALAVLPRLAGSAGRRRRGGAARRASAWAASRTSSSRSGWPRTGSAPGRAGARSAIAYPPDSVFG